ncbi:MAG: CoA pyrophosphatase [Prolixibacteraceae bacterium]|nr:CoA pyrophosphatase [Prolixibacteraceae bacterium]
MISSEKIRKALLKKLPGAKSHMKMLPKNRSLNAAQNDRNKLKHSSVLLLLFPENDVLKICLIKRPMHMKNHAGQIALPGGRIEKGETALETALRETNEEIGIDTSAIEILGSLSELYVEVSGFIIHPFVGWLPQKPNFVINPAEVEKIILFPLNRFLSNPDEIELETVKGKLKVPCVQFESEIIWGATAMILSEFHDLLNE